MRTVFYIPEGEIVEDYKDQNGMKKLMKYILVYQKI